MDCTGAGTRCGSCRDQIADMVEAEAPACASRRSLRVLSPAA
jgi:bacterioferritin-associated ferredoxin